MAQRIARRLEGNFRRSGNFADTSCHLFNLLCDRGSSFLRMRAGIGTNTSNGMSSASRNCSERASILCQTTPDGNNNHFFMLTWSDGEG